MREQDRLLPVANVNRIMKRALPSTAKIAKDAKETVQECVSEFIRYFGSHLLTIYLLTGTLTSKLYHERGQRPMSAGETENNQRRRHPVGDAEPWL